VSNYRRIRKEDKLQRTVLWVNEVQELYNPIISELKA
jgi:hypothetical protein